MISQASHPWKLSNVLRFFILILTGWIHMNHYWCEKGLVTNFQKKKRNWIVNHQLINVPLYVTHGNHLNLTIWRKLHRFQTIEWISTTQWASLLILLRRNAHFLVPLCSRCIESAAFLKKTTSRDCLISGYQTSRRRK